MKDKIAFQIQWKPLLADDMNKCKVYVLENLNADDIENR